VPDGTPMTATADSGLPLPRGPLAGPIGAIASAAYARDAVRGVRPRYRPQFVPRAAKPPFRSFWQGGFDAHDHSVQCSADRVVADYRRLLEFGIRTVREKADWADIDRAGGLALRSLDARARAAGDLGIQVVWTLFASHWPEDVYFLSTRFVDRFARYARAVAARLADLDPLDVPVYSPINEISYLAWSLHARGLVRRRDGSLPAVTEIKHQLVRAALAASDAILTKVPHARLMHTDPLEHVVAPLNQPDLAGAAARRNALQFETWDLLAGRGERDLGGEGRFLDLVGVNYYAENQWELQSGKRLAWQVDDPRRLPLSLLLKDLHTRYGRPIAIAETSHNGVRRASWIRAIATEVREAGRIGIPVEGVCLHPVIDQREPANAGQWLRRGLWEPETADAPERLDQPYAAGLRAAQRVTGL
jgi:UDP-galactopyranose mutase